MEQAINNSSFFSAQSHWLSLTFRNAKTLEYKTNEKISNLIKIENVGIFMFQIKTLVVPLFSLQNDLFFKGFCLSDPSKKCKIDFSNVKN